MAKTRSGKSKSASSANQRLSRPRKRYKNDFFLKTLGDHCRRLRLQRGYSIDRLSKESEQLSPASIDRLEKGSADTQILVLTRYSEALGLGLLDLFSFLKETPDLLNDPRIIPYEEDVKPPMGYIPVYPLKVAAGHFSNQHEMENVRPSGWVDANIRSATQDYFASFVQGVSMEPKIKDGALCLFKKYSGGTRQGRIFLIQARSLTNSETGESFVVKKYMRQTSPRQSEEESPSVIHLISENPRFSPIVLVGLMDEEIQTIAEFIRVL